MSTALRSGMAVEIEKDTGIIGAALSLRWSLRAQLPLLQFWRLKRYERVSRPTSLLVSSELAMFLPSSALATELLRYQRTVLNHFRRYRQILFEYCLLWQCYLYLCVLS
jgi:hypothetical protein